LMLFILIHSSPGHALRLLLLRLWSLSGLFEPEVHLP
jgi:hypothetical protein